MLTKKHYEIIATTLHLSKPPLMGFNSPQEAKAADDQFKNTVQKFIQMLTVDNPRFDAERFSDWIEEGGKVREGRTPRPKK